MRNAIRHRIFYLAAVAKKAQGSAAAEESFCAGQQPQGASSPLQPHTEISEASSPVPPAPAEKRPPAPAEKRPPAPAEKRPGQDPEAEVPPKSAKVLEVAPDSESGLSEIESILKENLEETGSALIAESNILISL